MGGMNILLAQSGGPTCAINASLLGAFAYAVDCGEVKTVYGALNGIEGLIGNRLLDLRAVIASTDARDIIRQTPGALLGSCRYKLPDCRETPDVYKAITARLRERGIEAVLYIGGNDSMDTVLKLHGYFRENEIGIRVLGIPKTIDNDLPETDHTPGFGSAAKYVATSVREIARDSSVYAVPSVTIVEIMGRNAGWLTAAAALSRANGDSAPHLIYLPERPVSVAQFLHDVKEKQRRHPAVVVAVAEGVRLGLTDRGGEMLSPAKNDAFGHSSLAGVGKRLETIVSRELGCKVRSVELGVLQRCAAHIRSACDIREADSVGAAAVKAALAGVSGKMIALKRVENNPYRVGVYAVDVNRVANRVKQFPLEWITPGGNDVTAAAIDYCLPLIQGEPELRYENGLPAQYTI